MPQPRKKNTSSEVQAKKDLVIGKPQQQVLSKAQQTFNRLSRKIAKLQQEITDTNRILDEKLAFYGKHIHQLEKQMIAVRKQLCKILVPYLTANKLLPKKDKKILEQIIARQLNDIFSSEQNEPDAEMKEIFAIIEGTSYDEAKQQDLEHLKTKMAEMFEELGFKVDLNNFRPNMSVEEMMEQMREMEKNVFQQAREKDSSPFSARKKTKKQLEKEEREKQAAEVTNKSISRIYKQLAKVLHPDLEQDANLKASKETRMRELTSAYEKNDLHTLLRLELEWIQKEEANLDKLTDEKLNIYNEVLKEQAADLQGEIYALEDHPRYQVLHQLSRLPTNLKWLNLNNIKKDLNKSLKMLQESATRFQGEDGLKEIKALISHYRRLDY